MHAREEEAYVRFVQERHAGLYRTAFLLTGNHHTAEDAVQSTFVKVYASWSRVPRADRPVDAHTVWHALETLSERQRTVVVMRYYSDLSEAEIADTLGIAPGTVTSHAHAALAAPDATLRAADPRSSDRVEEAT